MDNGIRNKKPAAGTAGQGKTVQGMATVHLYFSTTGKPIATLQGNVLKKRVRGSLHMLRRPPAWAVDAIVLQQARQDGAATVEVEDIETRRRYTAPIEAFDRWGIRFNRGFGDQVALPLSHWQTEPVGARQLSLLTEV
jgi:hypothetical protein